MNRKNRLWLIIGTGIVITLAVAVLALRTVFNCCALPPLPPTQTAQAIRATASLIVALNQTTEAFLRQTETAYPNWGYVFTITPSPLPYDATLYAQRRHEEQILQTGAGPTQYAIFFATETALVATYQGTTVPTFTPIPYDASMSPTALPLPSRTFTPTATLCPPSDVICPGGNATPNAAQIVLGLMASASAPEFGQLAQTATALYVTPTPTVVMPYIQCAWSWGRQDLPDVTVAAQAAIIEAGLENITVRSEAYGEDCSDSATGKHMGFGAMSTDFYVSATVIDLKDEEALGQIVITAYNTLINLDAKLPASHGYLDIEFKEGGEMKRFRTLFSQIKSAVEADESGAAVIEVGGGLV